MGIRTTIASVICMAAVISCPATTVLAQPFEIEFFERSVTGPDGTPVFISDLAQLAALEPDGIFEDGTAISTCCGSFTTLNTLIGLSTDPAAITEGSQALNISMTNNLSNQGGGNTAFDRPAILTITSADPRYSDIQAVAANPSNFQMVADITLIADEIPDTFSTDTVAATPFVQIGFFQNSGGVFVEPPSLRDALNWGEDDLIDLEASGSSTRTLQFPATDLNLPADPGSYSIGFVFNGNWQLTERAAFNIDNWRFEALFDISSLDINGDNAVDVLDFGILMANHLDPDADTFAEGDLDGDGDNDFDDYRFFEEGWNQIGGPIPFSALIAGVPEPSSAVLAVLLASPLVLGRRGRGVLLVLLVCGLAVVSQQRADAVLADTVLFDWEDGLQGWEESGDNLYNGDPNFSLSNSAIGSTQGGTQSFALMQPLDGFNWGATNSIFGNANFDALENALNIGAEHFVLEGDVTYDVPGSIPGGASFANISLRIQSSAGTSEVGGLANASNPAGSQTISFSEPLTSWAALPQQNGETGFYRFDIGMNGDWGFSPATFHFDNFRLRQVSEPAILTLEVDGTSGLGRIVNNSGADGTGPGGTGGPVELNYYQILSSTNRLNPAGWDSLDDQNIDAVDGSDPGSVAGDSPFEGWAASNGVAGAVAEANFLGTSTLGDTNFFDLDMPYTTGDGSDLTFLYREPGRPDFLRTGQIVVTNPVAPINADFDADVDVDLADLLTLQRGFGVGTTQPEGDADGNGVIDGADLTATLDAFGDGSAVGANIGVVPEPASVGLLAAGLACLARRRR